MNSKAIEEIPKDLIGKIKFTFREFFSIPKDASLKRAAIGAFLVYLPEIPAYFIPSFTQSKNTGCAKDLKHGEGVRGLLTGCLEGLAVGAIALKEKLSVKRVVPFMLLGAGLQFMSSLVMPRLGEKLGTFAYNKRKYTEKLGEIIDIPFGNDPQGEVLTQIQTSQKPQAPAQITAPQKPQALASNQVQFKGAMPYNQFNRGSLKI